MSGHGCEWYEVNGHRVCGVPAPEKFAARPLTRRDLRELREWRAAVVDEGWRYTPDPWLVVADWALVVGGVLAAIAVAAGMMGAL